jgi:hypothetical protein
MARLAPLPGLIWMLLCWFCVRRRSGSRSGRYDFIDSAWILN